MSEVYDGNHFSITHVGGEWMIWRFSGEDDREQIILTTKAMDELRDYFAAYYAEDRASST